MAEIIEFPTQDVRAWSAMEAMLRESFGARGLEADTIDYVCEFMKDIFETHLQGRDIKVSPACKPYVDAVTEHLQPCINKLFGALALREAYWYALQKEQGPSSG